MLVLEVKFDCFEDSGFAKDGISYSLNWYHFGLPSGNSYRKRIYING